MSSIIIRECLDRDFDDIFTLLQQLWPNLELSIEAMRDVFNQKMSSENDTLFCAEDKGKVIGFSAFEVLLNFSRPSKYGLVGEIIVDKNYREKGVGTSLINRIMERAREKGCASLELNSSLFRTGAHEFFLKNGFEKKAYLFYKEL
jgi:GNAT superfamily N-acetyltransferase